MLIQSLAVAFGRETEEALFEAYWRGLSDLPLDRIDQAAQRAVRTCRFMPKPVELRQLAGDLPADVRSLRAWAAVSGAIRAIGPYQSVDFKDPACNASVRALGGWPDICQATRTELRFLERSFRELYMSYLDSPQESGSYLPGLHELHNRAEGYTSFIRPPVAVSVLGGSSPAAFLATTPAGGDQ